MPKFLPSGGFKWIDPKDLDLNKYTSNSSKGRVLQVDLEYPKELCKLHNDYPLASDKLNIKKEMLSEYELNFPDFSNIEIGIFKKLVRNFCDQEKCLICYKNLQLYLRL